jgi:hypothetical protein
VIGIFGIGVTLLVSRIRAFQVAPTVAVKEIPEDDMDQVPPFEI